MSLGSDGEGSESGYSTDPEVTMSSDDDEEVVKDFGDGSPLAETILSFLGTKVADGKTYEPVVIARRSGRNTLTLELTKEAINEDSCLDDEENSDKE